MVTQWSRAHGESYLRRKWSGGGVGDVERLTKELWFRGIGQWRSGLGGSCSAVLGVPAERRRAEGRRNENGAASALGQARGGFKARLRRQEAHGAWQRDQLADDARRTRVRRFLKTVGHCSAHSVDLDRLTA